MLWSLATIFHSVAKRGTIVFELPTVPANTTFGETLSGRPITS
jgi:hypothetical protein